MGHRVISILGSTGSIGVQTLDVIRRSNDYEINYLTTNRNIDLLESQASEFKPNGVIICHKESYEQFKRVTSYKGKILFGDEGLEEVSNDKRNSLIVSTLVGFAGVRPTLNAIENGIDIALANKEILVAAGSIITKAAAKSNATILPIDSEHSAIQQCLVGEDLSQLEKIILTASGGPFLNTPAEVFEDITIKQALDHPNWSMGQKITIDSATMMNKGLEVIEAHWLFNVQPKDIEVIVHPQSIIHSLVQFQDGSVKAQLGVPDMKIPIAFALNYPDHRKYDFERIDLKEIQKLTFIEPDLEKFPNLKLAYDTIDKEGNMPCALNAANEVTVQYFLEEKIKFTDIPKFNQIAMEKIDYINDPSIEEIIDTDKLTRIKTKELINENYGIF